jgi:hypothetical protein
MDVRIHELGLDLLGPEGERTDGPDADWVDRFLFSLSGPIYAGTNEIQRNIIADRVLQLPRDRAERGPASRASASELARDGVPGAQPSSGRGS